MMTGRLLSTRGRTYKGIEIISVRFPNDYYIVFTNGFHEEGLPEVLFVDVPQCYLQDASFIIFDLIFECKNGETRQRHSNVQGLDRVQVATLDVMDPLDREQIIQFMLPECDPNARICLCKPKLDDWNVDPPYTSNPPEGMECMRDGIFDTWRDQYDSTGFYRYLDGNKENSSQDNLVMVSPYQAFVEYASVSDWDRNLTLKEKKYVSKHWDYFLRLALCAMGTIPAEASERYVKTVAANMGHAIRLYKEGLKVAPGSYVWDILATDVTQRVVRVQCAKCEKEEKNVGDFSVFCQACTGKRVVYCSRNCKKAHWKVHKKTCGKG